MTALKWEEGKMYQLRIDMADEFKNSKINVAIFNIIGFKTLIVRDIDMKGRVTELVGIPIEALGIDYWFYADEIKYFDLVEHTNVEDTEDGQVMISLTKTEQEIVVGWLNKLRYVMHNDSSVSEKLGLSADGNELLLSTDLCDIYSAEGVFSFISSRYKDMKSQAETKRKKELLDKRAELELQLAQINKELGE